MNPPPEGLHPIWALVYEKSGSGQRKPVTYRFNAFCNIILTNDGDSYMVRTETHSTENYLREVFTLRLSGDGEYYVTADRPSIVLAPWVHRTTSSQKWTRDGLDYRSGEGRNTITDRLDSLVMVLQDPETVLVES